MVTYCWIIRRMEIFALAKCMLKARGCGRSCGRGRGSGRAVFVLFTVREVHGLGCSGDTGRFCSLICCWGIVWCVGLLI